LHLFGYQLYLDNAKFNLFAFYPFPSIKKGRGASFISENSVTILARWSDFGRRGT